MVLMSTERSPDVSFSTCLIPGGQMSAWPRRSSMHHQSIFTYVYSSTPRRNRQRKNVPWLTFDIYAYRASVQRDRPSSPRRPMSRRWRFVAQAQQTRSPFGAWSFAGRGISCDDIPLTCWGQNRSERCELWPKRIDFLIHNIHDPI